MGWEGLKAEPERLGHWLVVNKRERKAFWLGQSQAKEWVELVGRGGVRREKLSLRSFQNTLQLILLL